MQYGYEPSSETPLPIIDEPKAIQIQKLDPIQHWSTVDDRLHEAWSKVPKNFQEFQDKTSVDPHSGVQPKDPSSVPSPSMGNAFENEFHDDMNDEKSKDKEKSVINGQLGQKREKGFAFNNEGESGGAKVIKPVDVDKFHSNDIFPFSIFKL